MNVKMANVPRTQDDLKKALNEQLQLLVMYADQYDSGRHVIAKPMATALRVLCHDSRTSRSLLGQLNLKGRYFYDTAASPDEMPTDSAYKLVGSSLGIIGMTHTAELIPYLDTLENRRLFGFSKFEDYWKRVILLDGCENPFRRKDIVLSVADQDGGAHVDPTLKAEYRELTRGNSMMIVGKKAGVMHDLNHVALVSLRQIAHEILRTFLIDYPRKEQHAPAGHPVFSARLMVRQEAAPAHSPPTPKLSYGRRKPRRNESCPCRSGEKYKKCHGKYFDVY